MRATHLIALLCVFVFSPGLLAQTPSPEAQKEQSNCRIELPYLVDQISSCSPQSAAAYDFAFCSVSFIIISVSAPESDRLLGENSKSESLRSKGMAYANVSEALSDTDTLRRNVALAKNYYEALKTQSHLIGSSIDYVSTKCGTVETHHAEALDELVKRLKSQSTDSR